MFELGATVSEKECEAVLKQILGMRAGSFF